MSDGTVIHESGHHSVVRIPGAAGEPDVYCVRRSGLVINYDVARLSGPTARADAIARADRLALDARKA